MALLGLALPRWNLTNFSIGFFRISMARDYIDRKSHQRRMADAEAGLLQGRHRHHRLRRPVGQGLLDEEQRQGRRLERRRHADPDQRRPAAAPALRRATIRPRSRSSATARASPPARSTQYPIAALEVVELEPAVYEAARFFDDVNHRPPRTPRSRRIVGDGRNFLTQRSDLFDVIISQPSNPWITGVSNLFTREYFQSVKSRLREDGIFCQWAQLYEMAPWNIKAIYRTVRTSSPTSWSSPPRICRRTPSSSPAATRRRSTPHRRARASAIR